MAGLRVRLQLLDDCMVNRKYWFFIDKDKNKTIQDVVDKINNRYSTCCDRLCLKDAELHFKEDIAILRDEDLIEVHCKQPDGLVSSGKGAPELFVEEEVTGKPKKKKKKKDKDIESIELIPEPVKPSAPVEPDENVDSSFTKPVKTKKKNVESTQLENEVPTPAVEPDENVDSSFTKPVKTKKKNVESTQLENEVPTPAVEPVVTSAVESEELMTPEVKSTRKRRRKRKKQHVQMSEPQESFQEQFTFPEVTMEPATRKHIRFDEFHTNECFESSSPIQKVAPPKEIPRKVSPKMKPKPLTSANFSSNGVPQELSALVSLRSAVFSRKSVPEEEELSNSKNDGPPAPQTVNGTPSDIDPMKYPLLTSIPRVGDIIAYKVLEMSENYTPEVSDYRNGRIIEASPSGEITIEIIGQPVIKKHSGGKFELIDLEEEDEAEGEVMEVVPETETVFTHHFNELIEPRLIYP